MARTVVNFTVTTEGRDKGKTFVLTEMPAAQGESWAMKAILALIAEGVDMPENFANTGMAGMVEIGIKSLSKLTWESAKPLLDEMWDCVQFMPDTAKPHITRRLFDEDIEEIITRVIIRGELFRLHSDFLKAVDHYLSGANPAAR